MAGGYTLDDTPEVVARIDADLDHVVAVVREGDPRLRSLVLTGGFARGEGAVRDGRPQNDYDLVAIRGTGRPRVPYPVMRERLARELGLHMDLAPVAAWRLRVPSRSIFWYETALRGRVLWGDDVLRRIPGTRADRIAPDEGLRLLVNRAAGLLLSIEADADERRLQAAKALLAAMDAHMLAAGAFPPSQRERWSRCQDLVARGRLPGLEPDLAWFKWAFDHKTRPGKTSASDADTAWNAAADLLLAAVPVALRHAGHRSLRDYGRHDGIMDHVHFARNAPPGAPRLTLHPTGQVRVATLRLLEDARAGKRPDPAILGRLNGTDDALARLEALRSATLQ